MDSAEGEISSGIVQCAGWICQEMQIWIFGKLVFTLTFVNSGRF